MGHSMNSGTLPRPSSKEMANSGPLPTDPTDSGTWFRGSKLYFGGPILPYRAAGVRFEGRPVSYMTVSAMQRPVYCGWGSELTLLYYRELLGYPSDPFEAASMGDEHWRKHRIEALLSFGETDLMRLTVMHISLLKPYFSSDPIVRLKRCLDSNHLFRIFEIRKT